MNESKNDIELVLKTLNRLEVRGKDNLDMLLGCILTLEKLVKDAATETAEVEADNG